MLGLQGPGWQAPAVAWSDGPTGAGAAGRRVSTFLGGLLQHVLIPPQTCSPSHRALVARGSDRAMMRAGGA